MTELRLRGERHTIARDRRAVRHHYDAGNDFFALFLDDSMTYSCAYWRDAAPRRSRRRRTAKLELVCTKLELQRGRAAARRRLRLGSMAIHAAARHGVAVLGVSLSEPQVRLAAERAAAAGVADQVEFRRRRLPRARRAERVRRDLLASGWSSTSARSGSISTLARCTSCSAGRPAAQPRHRQAGRLRHQGRGRRSPSGSCSPTAFRCRSRGSCRRSSGPGLAPRHVEGIADGLRPHARPLDRALRGPLRRGRADRRRGARARLEALPARRPPGLHDRLGLGLPGARPPTLIGWSCGRPRWGGRSRRSDQMLASGRLIEVEGRHHRDQARRIDLGMRAVVVGADLVEVTRSLRSRATGRGHAARATGSGTRRPCAAST